MNSLQLFRYALVPVGSRRQTPVLLARRPCDLLGVWLMEAMTMIKSR